MISRRRNPSTEKVWRPDCPPLAFEIIEESLVLGKLPTNVATGPLKAVLGRPRGLENQATRHQKLALTPALCASFRTRQLLSLRRARECLSIGRVSTTTPRRRARKRLGSAALAFSGSSS